MGHIDVWAYVIQSQRAASNRPPIAGIQLHGDRSAASLLHPGGHGTGNRSRQGPEASLSPSTSPSPNTNTHSTVPAPGLTLICHWRTQQDHGVTEHKGRKNHHKVTAKIISVSFTHNQNLKIYLQHQ